MSRAERRLAALAGSSSTGSGAGAGAPLAFDRNSERCVQQRKQVVEMLLWARIARAHGTAS
jgi:hypothetical protein